MSPAQIQAKSPKVKNAYETYLFLWGIHFKNWGWGG